MTLADVAALSPRKYVAQPKHDGCYARLHLDSRGCVERVLSRTGAHLAAPDLMGALVGWPDSVLVGELEAHTEAGARVAAARGAQACHLFDCIRVGGRYVAREPYRTRRDYLHRMQAEVVNLDHARDTQPTDHGRRGTGGKWARERWHGFELTPIVEQVPVSRVGALWDDHVGAGGEGLVIVALDSPVGRRRAKRKVKDTRTIDCAVVSVGPRNALLEYGGQVFAVGVASHILECGMVVELKHDGWYESAAIPRFPRIVRVRTDLRQ
jgi:ATP-dependent DNA ligase